MPTERHRRRGLCVRPAPLAMIYLLHFEPRYKHAGHYLGSADNVLARLADHRAGRGARLTAVAVAAGCKLILARVWDGGRKKERWFKGDRAKWHRGSLGKFCLVCHKRKNMESPTGIIPEELMFREKKDEVVKFLIAQPYAGDFKRRLLEGWCITVGVRCRSREFNLVYNSGFDGVNYGKSAATK